MLYENHRHQFYMLKKASEDRTTPDGQIIKKGEDYVRFYHQTVAGEQVALHINSKNIDLSLTGFFKIPDDLFNEKKVMKAERCDQCGGIFLSDSNERFCCEAHGLAHFNSAVIDADENSM